MHVIDCGAERATPITEYASRGASAQPLGDGAGEAHVYVVHLEPGGEIGAHPAGFDQLFLVVRGEGWVAGADGARHLVRAGHGAVIARGEVHAKGSDSGCSAVMIQLTELALPATVRK
ncbi:Cupin 2 conserved barrel domain protein (plasmid) [Gemmatirosa kalamazoonensis]|uniref:Cupin 2 conserved barrel domain protein n=1 Tax=Gemmatirosa kalamazoonensis TaxID=861299 RepID=W0RSV8_9BACT|nr:cupin domain-containing protein [Gemmatirosa kalamazoonensis]AHG93557.1 Cupin 2 conserved barrel domain protein [Gemmatirosa kalamazoonensis]